jgi:hypothetical protein
MPPGAYQSVFANDTYRHIQLRWNGRSFISFNIQTESGTTPAEYLKEPWEFVPEEYSKAFMQADDIPVGAADPRRARNAGFP